MNLVSEEEHSGELQNQLRRCYDERVDMAKRCVEKEDEISGVRRSFQEMEEKVILLETKIEQLVRENLELKGR